MKKEKKKIIKYLVVNILIFIMLGIGAYIYSQVKKDTIFSYLNLTIFGITFIFIMTILGASIVFLFRDININIKKMFLGFAAGVMIAASIWSLLIPSIDRAADSGIISYIPAAIGFICGGLFLMLIDKIVPHLHDKFSIEEGLKNKFKRSTKLILAVTIHNIPEGLAVGLAFGIALQLQNAPLIASAVGLAIAIGLQNFPEGMAVALPIKEETNSTIKGFIYGVISGIVEPIFAVLALFAISFLTSIMPWALGFAAGAMIYVVVDELIPESRGEHHSHFGTWGLMVGFVVMMILDVALG